MFTGIIQEVAKIISINKKSNLYTHTIYMSNDMINQLKTGDSISYNGCCLTVTKIYGHYVSVDIMKETLLITNLSELAPNDNINIERSAKIGDEIGGHLMSGHILTTAEITKINFSENYYQIWFKIKNKFLMKYLFHKGFIGIDGISLTIGEISQTDFCVFLIPETLKRTTIRKKKIKQRVNIEIDFQTQAIVDTVERVLMIEKSKREDKNRSLNINIT